MTDRDGRLLELAERISDGAAVDWKEAERGAADDRERRVIRHLRLLDSVASAHGSRDDSAPAGGLNEETTMPGPVENPVLRTWGPLEIREKIGEGAFGEVFRAWDKNLEREVALKLLKRESSAKEELASSVLREGRLLARVRHPNVVSVFGAETHDERVGLWMEFVSGASLAGLMHEQGRLGAREAALIGIDLCRALAAVHNAGLVHRDIKARNVMRERGGRIVLMDFGAGRDLHDAQEREDRSISGTPLYIAPEIFESGSATASSDIYSLGVLLYHLVTSSYPLQAKTFAELREKALRSEMRLLRDERSDLPAGFVRVVEKALEREPDRRHASPGQMEAALSASLGVDSAVETPRPQPAVRENKKKRMSPWAIASAAAFVMVAIVAAWMWFPDPAAVETYEVEAALYRKGRDGQRERLEPGDRLTLGDELTLEVNGSRNLHVYVINEDERGRAYALFPMPGLDLRNPLAAGLDHVLPGSAGGTAKSWVVDSPGGREHLLVLASPDPLVEFENEMNALPRPSEGQVAMPIPESAKIRLRGIGGMATSEQPASTGSADRLFDLATSLAGQAEVVRGVWVRHIELENPEP